MRSLAEILAGLRALREEEAPLSLRPEQLAEGGYGQDEETETEEEGQ